MACCLLGAGRTRFAAVVDLVLEAPTAVGSPRTGRSILEALRPHRDRGSHLPEVGPEPQGAMTWVPIQSRPRCLRTPC